MRNFILISAFLIISCAEEAEKEKIPPRDYTAHYTEAESFCKSKNLNQDFFILIDYAAHSGTDRFFIYNFKMQKVVDSFPVSHGCYTAPWGQTQTKAKAILSNIEESHAASKGKYLIRQRGVSQWGIKVNYVLDGLEATNNKARQRFIVLHSWEAVADQAVYPDGTPEGWGCPAISNQNMRKVDDLLQRQRKNTLLWAID